VRFEFESGIVLFVFLLSLFHSENRVCLSRGVQVAGAARARSDEDRGMSRRPDAEDRR
jgi:hypothetical protein